MEYRIWDKENNVYTNEDDCCNLLFVLQDGTLSQFKNKGIVDIINKDNYIVEPYVELVDDDMYMIYVGDILERKTYDGVKHVGVVESAAPGFWVRTDYEPMQDRFNYKSAHGLKVIGNIHEDPELLC